MKAWIQDRLKDFSLGEVALGSLFSLGLRIAGMAAAYVAQVLLARWLGGDDYGVFTYAYSWALVLSMVASLGLPSAALRFVPQYLAKKDWAHLKGAQRGYQGLGFLFSVVMAALSYPLLRMFLSPRLETAMVDMLSWSVLIIPVLAMISLLGEQSRAVGKMVGAYFPNMVLRPVLLCVAAFAAGTWQGFTPTSALAAALTSLVVVLLVQFIWTEIVFPVEARKARAAYEWRTWIEVSIPLVLIAGFFILLERIDILMLGSLAGAEDTGYYNAAARTATFVSFFLVAANSAVVPRLSRLLGEKRHDEMQRILLRASRWAFVPSLLAFLGLVAARGPVLSLFGEGFSEGGQTALVILAFGHLFSAAAGPVGHLLNISGNQNLSLVVYGVTAVFNVALNLVLIPRYGATGAAIATCVSMVCWNISQYIIVILRMKLWSSFLVRPASAAGARRD